MLSFPLGARAGAEQPSAAVTHPPGQLSASHQPNYPFYPATDSFKNAVF